MDYKANQWAAPLSFLLCAVFAFWLVLWTTPYGPGISPDSVTYWNSARSIASGNGFGMGAHYPPAYPLLLAFSRILGKNATESARWLHAVFFAANVLLIGMLTHLSAAKHLPAALCAVFLFLSSPRMLEIHTMSWSEPSFIIFSLASFLLLVIHISKPRFPVLAASAIFLGLAMSTRYVGITLLPPMILTLLYFGDRPRSSKIKDSLILSLIGIAPLAAWLIRNMLFSETVANRSFVFHPIRPSDVTTFADTMCDFWLPVGMDDWQKLLLIVSVVVLLVAMFRAVSARRGDAPVIIRFLLPMFVMTYIVFLVFSISFIDADTPTNARILAPVYVFANIFGISLFRSLSELKKIPLIWRIFVLICFLSIGMNTSRQLSSVSALHRDGRGYNSEVWKKSPSIAYAMRLPDNVMIYSNGADVIGFLTEKNVKPIPPKTIPGSLKHDTGFSQKIKMMCEDVNRSNAVILYLDNITWRWYLPGKEEVRTLCGMPESLVFDDGTIFVSKDRSKTIRKF